MQTSTETTAYAGAPAAGPGALGYAALALVLGAIANSACAGWDELDYSGGATVVYQRETASGLDEASASGDLQLKLPAGEGHWLLYLEGASGVDADRVFNVYPEVNADAGSVLDSNGDGHAQVSEFNYTFQAGDRELTLGQIDPSAQIDTSAIANDENTQFLGASFKNNATIEFPDYTLGLVYRRSARERSPAVTVMLSASDGLADNPTRSYRDLIDLSGSDKGLFAAGALRWTHNQSEIGAGLWLRTDDHLYLDGSGRESGNYGAFVVVDSRLGPAAVNLRAGFADAEVSTVSHFAAVAASVPLASATLGLGYARIFESDDAHSASSGDTDHAEAWLRVPLGFEQLQGSLSVQYVSNPGFDGSGNRARADALIAGLRLHYAF